MADIIILIAAISIVAVVVYTGFMGRKRGKTSCSSCKCSSGCSENTSCPSNSRAAD